ncbi:copper amine oxidase N-terminal domain-containing protein [Paenibacillus pasadenensis]|uniref:stalk domain-containing protein n=1 Tax=Paenibacillus pasadenensis TaxID=217090 RepID=UPI002041FC68|nr:stalk domain-containing protein [Paenibacillus pasadenensis]MCM3746214.1 copper amine oxidase N-terminal domain-containing protein [Paenibacillus pasadenensis]
MKGKKVLLLTLALTLWGGTLIFADSATQAIRVVVNGSELSDGGIMSDGKGYIPLRQLANQLQAVLVWDENTKKASITKPNVHMFLFKPDKSTFGGVDAGKKVTFSVFAQVDSLTTEIHSFKITITDPSGRDTLIHQDVMKSKKDNFWLLSEDLKYSFDSAGTYSIRFSIRLSAGDDWVVVSEKNLIAN